MMWSQNEVQMLAATKYLL